MIIIKIDETLIQDQLDLRFHLGGLSHLVRLVKVQIGKQTRLQLKLLELSLLGQLKMQHQDRAIPELELVHPLE